MQDMVETAGSDSRLLTEHQVTISMPRLKRVGDNAVSGSATAATPARPTGGYLPSEPSGFAYRAPDVSGHPANPAID
jgi:hypothetical protein